MAGDEQGGDLHPGVRPRQPREVVQHHVEVGAGQPLVELRREALEVHVDGVHGAEEFLAGDRRDVPGRDADGAHAPVAAGGGDVDGVLGEDDGVVVGERDGRGAGCDGGVGDVPGHCGLGEGVHLTRRGDLVVLAELAAQIAAGGAEAEHRRAGQEVVERLLLDRVETEPRRPPPRVQHQPAAVVGADEAESALAVAHPAFARAQQALHAPVVERAAPAGGAGALRRRHHRGSPSSHDCTV